MLGKLLCDGRRASGRFVTEHEGFYGSSSESLEINAGMFEETHVFSCDKSIDHMWGDAVVIGIDTVAGTVIISAEFCRAVRCVYERRKFIMRIFKLFDGGHVAYYPVIDQHQEKYDDKSKAQE